MANFLKNYYGGRSLPEVARVIHELNTKGMEACVSLLPRVNIGRRGIDSEKAKYLAILPFLKERGLNADLTVKLSQFGERWRFADCVEALSAIASQCAEYDSFLWVDMEQSSLIDTTIEAFEIVAKRHDNIGICLQTYLKRTGRDLNYLMEKGYPARLVKGYYREWPPQSYGTWKETTQNFANLIPLLLEKSRRPAIGTHDPYLLNEAKRALARTKVLAGASPSLNASPLEFQFFLGARPELPARMASEGQPVRIYIPYGALLPYLLHSLPYMDISRNVQRVMGFKTIR